MNNFEFIKYEPTPNGKQLGIVTAKAYNKIILRLKVVSKKEGSGYFPTAPAIRLGDDSNPIYLAAFILDSRSDEEEFIQVIRNGIKPYFTETEEDQVATDACPF